jgi:hypothetical protein
VCNSLTITNITENKIWLNWYNAKELYSSSINHDINIIMKRKYKQRWVSIPPISTKRTITSHFKSQTTNKDNDI